MSISSIPKKNAKVKDLIERAKSDLFKDNFTRLADEVMALHDSRASRELKAGRIIAPKVLDSVAVNNANRSRIAAIHAMAARKKALLEIPLKSLLDEIWVVHGGFLDANYRTKEEKERYIRNMLDPVYRKIRNYESLIELCEIVMNDIDASGRSMYVISEVLKLANKREI